MHKISMSHYLVVFHPFVEQLASSSIVCMHNLRYLNYSAQSRD